MLFLVTVISLSLLFVGFKLIYRSYFQCWRILFLTLFLTDILCLYRLWDIRPNAGHEFSYSLAHLFNFFHHPLHEWPRVSNKGNSPGVIDKISAIKFGSQIIIFNFFFHLHLFDYVCFQYSQIIIIIYSFRVFHISVTWWFFTGVWVTASLLKSPGLVSRFWPFSAMLSFGWSPPVRQLPSPPVPLVIL